MQVWRLNSESAEPHRPRALRSDEGANRVILLALDAGQDLNEHEVREHALVFVIAGEVVLRSGAEQETVMAPALVYLRPAERHAVHANSACRLVICLAPW